MKRKMQGKHFYEYAVIRLLPRVEREEFINVGVILFSKSASFINGLYHLDKVKLENFSTELELEDVEKNLQAFMEICCGTSSGGPVAKWDMADRFRWLTAERSSSIQTSRPHNGFCDNPDKTLERLFKELVL